MRVLLLFSLPILGGAVEAGGSNSEAEGEGGLGDGVLRGRGRSAVVGVRMSRVIAGLSSVKASPLLRL